MTLKFILMVNKQGQTRLCQYYETLSIVEKSALEGEIIRKCLARTENQCSFIEYQSYKCVYRRYASLFFIVGVDSTANELAILEFIHALVETLDKYFENVCELDVRLPRAPYLCSRRPSLPSIVSSLASLSSSPLACACPVDHVQHRAGALHPGRDGNERQDRRHKQDQRPQAHPIHGQGRRRTEVGGERGRAAYTHSAQRYRAEQRAES